MITELNFKSNVPRTSSLYHGLEYARDLPAFQGGKTFTFNPGVNIIYGENGCGKSTILKILALTLAAKQGGRSVVTSDWHHSAKNEDNVFGVIHDGQPVLSCDTNIDVGLIMGHFDDDFFEAGLEATLRRDSSGWTRLNRMKHVLNALKDTKNFPEHIEIKGYNKNITLPDVLKATIPVGQRTILIDEPESALSFSAQQNIIRFIIQNAKDNDYQVIMATHSPFILEYCNSDDITFHSLSKDPHYLMSSQLQFIELARHIEKNF